jgi:hypothetical protein
MQIGTEQLKTQQRIMESKNLYNGKIDGIWGPKSIAAKLKWECSGKFAPAIPNNGFPLNERGPFPAGVKRLPTGELTCVELERKALEAKKAENPVSTNMVPQQNGQNTQNQNGQKKPHNQPNQQNQKPVDKPEVEGV